MAKAQLFAALLVIGLIACTSASPALMEQVKKLNEQGLERRDVASGKILIPACFIILSLYYY